MIHQSPIFLKPVFHERIWGGTALNKKFGYEIPSNLTGECWAISAHPNGESVVRDGKFKGMTLKQLWDHHRELFGNQNGEKFPLLTKILDANKDLSVQVHPNDEYAKTNENGELGKTECWYIIDCNEDAEIVLGHHANSKEEFVTLLKNGQWDELLKRVKIKPGDFFYVPSGTIHALCEGTLVLETQQSSDTTYRVYDYDRTDDKGQKRELHLDKAIEVTAIPHQDKRITPKIERLSGGTITTFVQEKYFSVYKWEVNGELYFQLDHDFLLCSVISGEGIMEIKGGAYTIKKGDHFILPTDVKEVKINGQVEMIVSHN